MLILCIYYKNSDDIITSIEINPIETNNDNNTPNNATDTTDNNNNTDIGNDINIEMKKEPINDDLSVAMAFKNVAYSISKFRSIKKMIIEFSFMKHLDILYNVTGYIPENKLCGIIGESGAGKTTVLGLLSSISKSGTITGDIHSKTKKIVFVSQIPSLPSTETVYEIVYFSARCTSDNLDMSFDDIISKVDNVLKELHIYHIRKRQIRYLSGGEVKRVSIAIQLVTNPDIMILDECTSGLDTPNALSLIQTLKKVVLTRNCTVIMSIHQPQKRICDLIDWLICMKSGLLIYQGTLENSIKCRNVLLNKIVKALNSHDNDSNDIDLRDCFNRSLIKKLGDMYNINLLKTDNINKANDILNDIDREMLSELITNIMEHSHDGNINVTDYLLETEYISTPTKLYNHWVAWTKENNPNFINIVNKNIDNQEHTHNFHVSFNIKQNWYAFKGLTLRTLHKYYRDLSIVLLTLIINILAGVILGLMYGDMGTDSEDVQNRFGAFGFLLMFIGILAISGSTTFIDERNIFIDERNGKLYNTLPYLFASILPDLIFIRIIPSLIFSIIFHVLVGFQKHTLGAYIGVVILFTTGISVFILCISSLSPNNNISLFIGILFNMLFMLYGGVFIPDQHIESLVWILQVPKYLSLHSFAFEILMVNEFTGLSFGIDTVGAIQLNGIPLQIDGIDVALPGSFFINFFGLDINDKPFDYTMLILWINAYIVITFLSLQFLNKSKR